MVADFLPPILQRLTVYVPQRPSVAESDAAIRLASAVVGRYGQQSTDVELAALPANQAAPPSGPLERAVIVREGDAPGVSLLAGDGVPALLIGGSAGDLANQSRLLSSDMSRLALASKAVAGTLKSSPQLPGDETTIRALGQPGVNATALKPQVSVGLDQTRLGRPVHDVRVHLKGSYTPLPSSVAGQLTASVGGQQVDRWAIWASEATEEGGVADGTIDRWVTVPNDLLMRYTNLDVAIDLSGNTGRCGEFQPVTLTIDGATTVESKKADPPTPSGLQSLPQALMPKLNIGLGDNAFADTSRALTIVEGLQRLGSLPIDTTVMTVDDALGSDQPALLIAANGWTNDAIELPVSEQGGEVAVESVTGGEASTLTLDPAVRLGSLQTVLDGSRTLVVATSNGEAAQLDSLLDWLDADARRWSRLDGSAVVAVADQPPVMVGDDEPAPVDQAATAAPSGGVWWVAGGAAIAALAALVALLVVRRRRRT